MKKTLIKDGKRRQFSDKAAEIAVEHLGWSELPPKPSEVGTRTQPKRIIVPPEIIQPVKAQEIPVVKSPEIPVVEKAATEPVKPEIPEKKKAKRGK